jgi:acetyl-CoA carboxylase biotin carboxyl carrier protein
MRIKNIDELKELLALLQDHDIAEISLKQGFSSLTVKKGERATAAHHRHAPATGEEAGKRELVHPKTGPYADEVSLPDEIAIPQVQHHEIKAPLVGTFYRAPTPGAEPFIEVGDRVNAEDTLCIIEAMKSMNEIKADISGVIQEIRAQNGQLVEFGQILILIDRTPSAG